MNNILNNCNTIQANLPCCHTDGRWLCSCTQCLQDGFYAGVDTYSCLKKLCFYTMNYGPAYVSEIYHFLGTSQLLEQNFQQDINVLSLGCGFGPDFMALHKYVFDNNLQININYTGYDLEPNWLHITNGIIPNVPIVANLLNGFSLSNFNIIFLNKLFSTILKAGTARQFLDQFTQQIINSMSIGSFIVFNDVNHYKMGRDIFDTHIRRVIPVSGRYFFDVESAYNGNYVGIAGAHNICQIPPGLPINPKRSVTKSVFFTYKKTN